MNLQDQIKTVTLLEKQPRQKVIWGAIKKSIPPSNPIQVKGEVPYQLEICKSYYSRSSSESIPFNKRNIKGKKGNFHKATRKNIQTIKPSYQRQSSCIISSEVSGGSQPQSNEAIEKRNRERQEKFTEENDEQNNINLLATSFSDSSESESDKTTMQDSYELMVANNEQIANETLLKANLQRYKKNALMLGLLRGADYTDVEREDTISTDGSLENYHDLTSSFDDVGSEIMNLNIEDENVMHNERIARFFQS